MKLNEEQMNLLYGQIQADDPRNYQPEFPYPNPPRNPSPEEFRGPNVKDLIKDES